jgi:hypothetical protein
VRYEKYILNRAIKAFPLGGPTGQWGSPFVYLIPISQWGLPLASGDPDWSVVRIAERGGPELVVIWMGWIRGILGIASIYPLRNYRQLFIINLFWVSFLTSVYLSKPRIYIIMRCVGSKVNNVNSGLSKILILHALRLNVCQLWRPVAARSA